MAQVTDQFPLNHMDALDGYGNRIVLDHGLSDGKALVSYYAHLYPGIPVKAGDLVKTGQEIGRSDNCGSSTGPHLHAETRSGNTPFDWWKTVRYSVEEVDTGMSIFLVPTFPTLIKVKLLTTEKLFIRQRPSALAKMVGYLAPGATLDVIGGTWVGGDYWIQIGYDQYCAVFYQGNVWAEFV